MFNFIEVTYLFNLILTKHNFVGSFSVHVLLVKLAVEDLDVTTSTVNVLFVLHSKLDNQRLVLVAERLEFLGNGVKPCIL